MFSDRQLSWLPGQVRRKVIGKQGQKAVQRGRRAEDAIASILRDHGYGVQRQAEVGRCIYGTTLRVDFLVRGVTGYPGGLIIESKWQGSAGSVDEKYPYLVENVKTRMPCPAIIVVGGGGMRDGAIDWLKRQVDGEKLVGVFRFEEFITWTMENL